MKPPNFPPGFPDDLASIAYRGRYPKGADMVAWKFPEAVRVIDWLEAAGYAVNQTDYFVVEDLTDPAASKEIGYGMSEFYDPKESWAGYTKRCAASARKTAGPKGAFVNVNLNNVYLAVSWLRNPSAPNEIS